MNQTLAPQSSDSSSPERRPDKLYPDIFEKGLLYTLAGLFSAKQDLLQAADALMRAAHSSTTSSSEAQKLRELVVKHWGKEEPRKAEGILSRIEEEYKPHVTLDYSTTRKGLLKKAEAIEQRLQQAHEAALAIVPQEDKPTAQEVTDARSTIIGLGFNEPILNSLQLSDAVIIAWASFINAERNGKSNAAQDLALAVAGMNRSDAKNVFGLIKGQIESINVNDKQWLENEEHIF